MESFKQLFYSGVPQEIAEKRAQSKASFNRITNLAPQLTTGDRICFASKSLVTSLLDESSERGLSPLRRFVGELGLEKEDRFLKIYFENFVSPEGKFTPWRSICLARAGDDTEDRLKVGFHKKTFQQGKIVIKTPAGTETTPSALHYSPSYNQDEQLLSALFTHLEKDLEAARHNWASSLVNDREEYFKAVAGKTTPSARKKLEQLVVRAASAFKDEEFMLVGEPVEKMEKGRIRLFTTLKMDEEKATRWSTTNLSDYAQAHYGNYNVVHRYSRDNIEHNYTGTYAITVDDQSKTVISVQTYDPNSNRVDFSQLAPPWSRYSASKQEQDFAHYLAGDKEHRWGLNGLDKAVLLSINPNQASGIGIIF